ncbi:hypothetical protein C8Q75DRAFT_830898 [Abortiporus biennis]|nr:hypothetical protein C8Q75DRAFT_830898 [Abortiporus biennis]
MFLSYNFSTSPRQAENTVFKVHRYYLTRESDFFHDLFSLPRGDEKDVEGTTDENAILLPGVTARQFELVLEYFYLSTQNNKTASWTTEDLKDILAVSTMFLFTNLRTLVITQIDNRNADVIPAVEKINLARKHDVLKWIIPAYKRLCTRDDPLSFAEASQLGLDVTLKLCRIREKLAKDCDYCIDNGRRGLSRANVDKLLSESFPDST